MKGLILLSRIKTGFFLHNRNDISQDVKLTIQEKSCFLGIIPTSKGVSYTIPLSLLTKPLPHSLLQWAISKYGYFVAELVMQSSSEILGGPVTIKSTKGNLQTSNRHEAFNGILVARLGLKEAKCYKQYLKLEEALFWRTIFCVYSHVHWVISSVWTQQIFVAHKIHSLCKGRKYLCTGHLPSLSVWSVWRWYGLLFLFL